MNFDLGATNSGAQVPQKGVGVPSPAFSGLATPRRATDSSGDPNSEVLPSNLAKESKILKW